MATETSKDIRITQIERLDRWWAATALDGTRVNIFPPNDRKPGTLVHFGAAGYREIAAMPVGSKLRWVRSPIVASVELKGQYWEVVAVEARAEGALPDVVKTPNASEWRRVIRQWAWRLVMAFGKDHHSSYVVFDTETTGTQPHDAIISAALLYWQDAPEDSYRRVHGLDAYLESLRLFTMTETRLFQPYDWSLLDQPNGAASVHGITAEALRGSGLEFGGDNGAGWDLHTWLSGNHVIGYNVQFDLYVVAHNLTRHDMSPMFPLSVIDVMPHAAAYIGQWDAARERWRNWKLSEAAEILGIDATGAHDALADCWMTLDVLLAMAGGVEPYQHKIDQFSAEKPGNV